jgi:SRSO17 transposase
LAACCSHGRLRHRADRSRRRPTRPLRWLLVEWPAGQPEPVKYWLSNLPADSPLVELVGLGKLRGASSRRPRAQRRAGPGPLRRPQLAGLAHHVTLVSIAHGFLTLERLRRPKQLVSA